ncbi:MAG: hypothetical protein ACXQTA_04030 [Candidatus Syntropharchaeales archaeon]
MATAAKNIFPKMCTQYPIIGSIDENKGCVSMNPMVRAGSKTLTIAVIKNDMAKNTDIINPNPA